MSSSAFVCLLARLRKDYSADFHKSWWKSGSRAKEETDFGGTGDHLTLGLG